MQSYFACKKLNTNLFSHFCTFSSTMNVNFYSALQETHFISPEGGLAPNLVTSPKPLKMQFFLADLVNHCQQGAYVDCIMYKILMYSLLSPLFILVLNDMFVGWFDCMPPGYKMGSHINLIHKQTIIISDQVYYAMLANRCIIQYYFEEKDLLTLQCGF